MKRKEKPITVEEFKSKRFRKFGNVTLRLEYVIEGPAAKRRAEETARYERKYRASVRVVKRKPGVYAIYTSEWASIGGKG